MKDNCRAPWILVVFVVLSASCGFAILLRKSLGVPTRSKEIHQADMAKDPAALPSVRVLFPHPSALYRGATIQLDFFDENGRPLSLDEIYIGPVSDGGSSGGIYSLEGAQSLKLAYVDRQAGGREIRSGIRYQAYKSLIIDGRPFFRRTEFVAPKLEPSKELYQLTLVLPTPPKARPIPAPMPFQLEGTAPRTDPENKMLHISYFFKGREVPSEAYVVNGKSFKFGVESLGGDLVFSDIDRRIVYGLNLAVDSPKIGEVVTIRGHRKYTVTRSVSKSAEAVTFFPLDQKRIPLSVAVFPPGASETEVLVVPGKYQIRFTEVPKRENSKEMPASDIELGDAPIIRLR